MEQSTIKLSKKVKNDLKKQMNHPGETYETVITRLLKITQEDDMLSKQIIKNIEANPDVSFDELYKKLTKIYDQFSLTGEEWSVGEEAIKTYIKKHGAIRRIRKEYPDDSELFEATFGIEPKGKVEVLEGPMVIYFRLYNIEDYARIYANYTPKAEATPEDIEKASKSGGCVARTPVNPEILRGSIILENVQSGRPADHPRAKEVFKHEGQHALNNLFKERSWKKSDFSEMTNAKTDEEKKEALTNCLLRDRRPDEAKLKDELLAFFKGAGSDPLWIWESLIKSEKNGGLYDYYSKRKDAAKSFLFNFILLKENDRSLFEEIYEKVYKTKFHNLITKSMDAFQLLRDRGLSLEQTIALLTHEPLRRWEVVAKRIESKKSQ